MATSSSVSGPIFGRRRSTETDAQVVIRQTGALGGGALFEHLIEHAADRTTLFCVVGDLRKEGAPIGQPLSWERTAQDVASAVRMRSDLMAARRIVVGLSASGAVVIDPTGQDLLIYDPQSQEGDWERSRPGVQFGTGTVLVDTLAWELAKHGSETDFRSAVRSGIETGRILHDEGYDAAPSQAGTQIRFPVQRIADSIVDGEDVESEIQCVPISLDSTWRIFDATSTGSFREAADQIARFGVTRVANEIPLETMGHWSSVDRIEIESMRSLRNIISEYLASPGRPRPLNLSVFGPPGSGKSFAIKQMASVIAPEQNRLGSLEFNLSQFQSVTDLPNALQQVRDLRLREFLPLVFWDEFDSALDGRELGWLSSFLAPMQDGSFTQNGIVRPIGPAIFIFAGGTHATMESFKSACPRTSRCKSDRLPEPPARVRQCAGAQSRFVRRSHVPIATGHFVAGHSAAHRATDFRWGRDAHRRIALGRVSRCARILARLPFDGSDHRDERGFAQVDL